MFFNWQFRPTKSFEQICKGMNSVVLSASTVQFFFLNFLQPFLPALAGQLTECEFLPLPRFWNWKTHPSFWTVNREESCQPTSDMWLLPGVDRKSPRNSQSGKRASFPVSRQQPLTLCVIVLLPPQYRHRCGVLCYLNKLSASSAESRASEQGRHHRRSVRRNGHLGNSPAHPWHPRGEEQQGQGRNGMLPRRQRDGLIGFLQAE